MNQDGTLWSHADMLDKCKDVWERPKDKLEHDMEDGKEGFVEQTDGEKRQVREMSEDTITNEKKFHVDVFNAVSRHNGLQVKLGSRWQEVPMTCRGCLKWIHLDPSGHMEKIVACIVDKDIVKDLDLEQAKQANNFDRGEAYVKESVGVLENVRDVRYSDERVIHQQLASVKVKGDVYTVGTCKLKYQRKIERGRFQLCGVEMRLKNRQDPTLPYVTKVLVRQIVIVPSSCASLLAIPNWH